METKKRRTVKKHGHANETVKDIKSVEKETTPLGRGETDPIIHDYTEPEARKSTVVNFARRKSIIEESKIVSNKHFCFDYFTAETDENGDKVILLFDPNQKTDEIPFTNVFNTIKKQIEMGVLPEIPEEYEENTVRIDTIRNLTAKYDPEGNFRYVALGQCLCDGHSTFLQAVMEDTVSQIWNFDPSLIEEYNIKQKDVKNYNIHVTVGNVLINLNEIETSDHNPIMNTRITLMIPFGVELDPVEMNADEIDEILKGL